MKHLSVSYILCVLLLSPTVLRAQGANGQLDLRTEGFVPLIGIPGLDAAGYNVNEYVNIIYVLAISIAAFIAVVRLIFAGLKYMFTDVVPTKSSAKTEIRNAILGLLIVVGAVLILNTINPQLTTLTALNFEAVNVTAPRATPVPDRLPRTQNETGLDVVEDVPDLPAEERGQLIADCIAPTDGTPGEWVLRGDGSGYCVGTETESAEPNLVNTETARERYIAEQNLSGAEAEDFRRRFNQFVATQEPETIDDEYIGTLLANYEADEVVFIVKTVEVASATPLEGYESSQEVICKEITGSNNIVEDRTRGYLACLR